MKVIKCLKFLRVILQTRYLLRDLGPIINFFLIGGCGAGGEASTGSESFFDDASGERSGLATGFGGEFDPNDPVEAASSSVATDAGEVMADHGISGT